jgi:hypothetical protein
MPIYVMNLALAILSQYQISILRTTVIVRNIAQI